MLDVPPHHADGADLFTIDFLSLTVTILLSLVTNYDYFIAPKLQIIDVSAGYILVLASLSGA